MNPKIKELATYCISNSYEMRINIDDFERFAHLIIEECINRIESKLSSGENGDQWTITRDVCYYQMIQELKEHFGVDHV